MSGIRSNHGPTVRTNSVSVPADHVPSSSLRLVRLDTLLVRQRKYAVAARVFAEAANLNPLEPQYFFLQGVALIDQSGNIETKEKETNDTRNYFLAEAEKVLLRAYEVSGKKLALVHLQLARVYEKKGDRKKRR